MRDSPFSVGVTSGSVKQLHSSDMQVLMLLIVVFIWSLLEIRFNYYKKCKYQKFLGNVTVKVVAFIVCSRDLVKWICFLIYEYAAYMVNKFSTQPVERHAFLFLFLGDSQSGECLWLAVAGAPRYGPRRTRVSLQEYGFPPQKAHWWERWMHRSMRTYLSHIELMRSSRCGLHSFSCVLFVH